MKSCLRVILILCILSAGWREGEALESSLDKNCATLYERSGFCPDDVCRLDCLNDAEDNCLPVCLAKPCEEIATEHCPEDICDLIDGCVGDLVCYAKQLQPPPECGALAYTGGQVDCCEGFQERCGLEFFDGSCDMVGASSIYSVPICIPCGNGICNQFENACNCPEDCQRRDN